MQKPKNLTITPLLIPKDSKRKHMSSRALKRILDDRDAANFLKEKLRVSTMKLNGLLAAPHTQVMRYAMKFETLKKKVLKFEKATSSGDTRSMKMDNILKKLKSETCRINEEKVWAPKDLAEAVFHVDPFGGTVTFRDRNAQIRLRNYIFVVNIRGKTYDLYLVNGSILFGAHDAVGRSSLKWFAYARLEGLRVQKIPPGSRKSQEFVLTATRAGPAGSLWKKNGMENEKEIRLKVVEQDNDATSLDEEIEKLREVKWEPYHGIWKRVVGSMTMDVHARRRCGQSKCESTSGHDSDVDVVVPSKKAQLAKEEAAATAAAKEEEETARLSRERMAVVVKEEFARIAREKAEDAKEAERVRLVEKAKEAEKARLAEEKKAAEEAEERARLAREKKAADEAEERARLAREKKATEEAEERARLAREKKAAEEAEERARLAREKKAAEEAEERARLAREKEAAEEAEERARLAREKKAAEEAEERARLAREKKAAEEAEERARLAREKKAAEEAEERARLAREKKAAEEAEERARLAREKEAAEEAEERLRLAREKEDEENATMKDDKVNVGGEKTMGNVDATPVAAGASSTNIPETSFKGSMSYDLSWMNNPDAFPGGVVPTNKASESKKAVSTSVETADTTKTKNSGLVEASSEKNTTKKPRKKGPQANLVKRLQQKSIKRKETNTTDPASTPTKPAPPKTTASAVSVSRSFNAAVVTTKTSPLSSSVLATVTT
eukprot:g903.t1